MKGVKVRLLASRLLGAALCAVALASCSYPGSAVREAPERTAVGVYYFPGWTETPGAPWNPPWEQIAPFPERIPLLGFYREGEVAVAEQHIDWAAEHGIRFFVYDWYWTNDDRPYLEHALEAYLRAGNRRRLGFALLWANHPPFRATADRVERMARYWTSRFFLQPEYVRVDARPVVVVFSPRTLRRDLGGSAAVRSTLDRARQVARQAGFPGIYFVGAAGPDQITALLEEGFDAATAYDYPLAGIREPGAKRGPYRDAVEEYARIWEQFARDGRLPYFVPTLAGRDARPWHGDRAIVREGSTPAAFREMLQRARTFARRHPDLTRGIVLVMAWNEFGEGGYVEPTRQWGFAYLEAIRDVFGVPR
jgi:hypothetical protein